MPPAIQDLVAQYATAGKVAMDSETFIAVSLNAHPLTNQLKNVWEVLDALSKETREIQSSLSEVKEFLPQIPALQQSLHELKETFNASNSKIEWAEKFVQTDLKLKTLGNLKDPHSAVALLKLRELRKRFREVKELSRWPGEEWKKQLQELILDIHDGFAQHDRHCVALATRAKDIASRLEKGDALQEIKEAGAERIAAILDPVNMLAQVGAKNRELYRAEVTTDEEMGAHLKELINYYTEYYALAQPVLWSKGFVLNEEYKAVVRDLEGTVDKIDVEEYENCEAGEIQGAIEKVKDVFARTHATLVQGVWAELDDIEEDIGMIHKEEKDLEALFRAEITSQEERISAAESDLAMLQDANDKSNKLALDVSTMMDQVGRCEENIEEINGKLESAVQNISRQQPPSWRDKSRGPSRQPSPRSTHSQGQQYPSNNPSRPDSRNPSREPSEPAPAEPAESSGSVLDDPKNPSTRPSSTHASSRPGTRGSQAAGSEAASEFQPPQVEWPEAQPPAFAQTGNVEADMESINRKIDDMWTVLSDKADRRSLEDVERSLHARFEELMHQSLQDKVDREALEMIHKQLQDMIDGKADAKSLPALLGEKVDKASLENMQQHIMTKMDMLDKNLRNEVSNQLEMKIDTFEKGLEDRLAYLQDMIAKQDDADFDEERFRKELEDNKADLAELASLINQKVDMDALNKAMKDKSVDLEAKADLSYTEELFNRFSKAVEALSSQIDKSKTEKGHVQAIDLGLQLLRLQLSEKADRDDIRKLHAGMPAPGSPQKGPKSQTESAALLGRGIFHCLSCDKEVQKVQTKPTSIASYSLPVSVRPRTAYDFRRNDPSPHTTDLDVSSPGKDPQMGSILEEKSIPNPNAPPPKRKGSPVKVTRDPSKPTVLFGSDGQIYRGRKSKIPPINHTQTTLPIRS